MIEVHAPPAKHFITFGTATKSAITKTVYDKGGRVRQTIDPLERTTDYHYDALDRLTVTELPIAIHVDDNGNLYSDRATTTIDYDLVGNKLRETDTLDKVTTYVYDQQYRLTQRQEPPAQPGGSPSIYTYTYDKADQRRTEKDPQQRVTTYNYDPLGRVIKIEHPDPGNGQGQPITEIDYNLAGLTTKRTQIVTGQPNVTTTYVYDNLLRKTQEIDGNDKTTFYTYDLVGNQQTVKDPANNTTTNVYDAWNRVVRDEITVNGSTLTRAYHLDREGRLQLFTDRNLNQRYYEYDAADRRTREIWLDNAQPVDIINTTYDIVGRVHSVSDAYSSYTYGYDQLDRLTVVDNTGTPGVPQVLLTMAYDELGRRRKLWATIDGTPDFENTYRYNDRGLMTEIVQTGFGGHAVADKHVLLEYDDADQNTAIDRYASDATSNLVVGSALTYDLDQRLETISHRAADLDLLAGYQWSYDEASRVTRFFSSNDGTADYTYDGRSQLTDAEYDGYQTNEHYAYDNNGNRTTYFSSSTGGDPEGVATGDQNRLQHDGQFSYVYDDNGNTIARFVDADQNNLLSASDTNVTVYGWDVRNRLTAVRDYATGSDAIGGQNATQTVSYSYDVLNHRIATAIDTNGDGFVDERHRFVLDGDAIVLRFSGAEGGDLTNRYLWGPVVDQLFADEQIDELFGPGVEGQVLWPLTDNLGTVRDLAFYDGTDTSVVNHKVYDSFGNITAERHYDSSGNAIDELDPDAVDTIFAFTGQEFDDETELYYYNERYYDSATGRFLSPDPIQDDYNNPYRYVGNNPTNNVDPTGLEEQDANNLGMSRAYIPQYMDTHLLRCAVCHGGGGYVNIVGGSSGVEFMPESQKRVLYLMNAAAIDSQRSHALRAFEDRKEFERFNRNGTVDGTNNTEVFLKAVDFGLRNQARGLAEIPLTLTDAGTAVIELTYNSPLLLVDGEYSEITKFSQAFHAVDARIRSGESYSSVAWSGAWRAPVNTFSFGAFATYEGIGHWQETGSPQAWQQAAAQQGAYALLLQISPPDGIVTPSHLRPLSLEASATIIRDTVPPASLMALTEAEAISLAKAESFAFAARLRQAAPEGAEMPAASTALVDRATSNVYHAISRNGERGAAAGAPPEIIHPSLQCRMPSPSLEYWNVWNCAEFNAVNNALNSGAHIQNLYWLTLRPRTDLFVPTCANCAETTVGGTGLSP